MLDAVILIALLVVLYGVGRRCLRGVPFADGAEEAIFALGLGFGLLAYATLALGILGVLRLPTLVSAGAAAAWIGRREAVSGVARGLRAAGRFAAAAPAGARVAVVLASGLLAIECVLVMAPAVGGDQTKYQLVYPRLFAESGGFVPTPWSFWGYMQYLVNMLFTAAFVLRGDVLARFVNVAFGVLATAAVFALGRRAFGRTVGAWAALLFFCMPFTATLMVRAWVEFALTLYVVAATIGVLAWRESDHRSWLALAAVMGGFAAGTKLMGVLAPALLGVVILATALARGGIGPALRATIGFGLVAMLVASPCYLRNAVATGNPIFPFGYGVFGGRYWSAEAARGLDDYYAAYRQTHAQKRGGGAYGSWREALRFPWDATMAPYAFENVGRFAYDVGPFLLAFAPAVVLVRRDPRAWILAGVGLGYGAIVVLGVWAHPRYIHPALALVLVVAVYALRTLADLGPRARRAVTAVFAATALWQGGTAFRVAAPLAPDSFRVAVGRLSEDAFLRRYERRYPLWDLVNREVPADGNVLILAMIPHPYHILRPFTLASPLEQGAIDYRRLAGVGDLAAALAPYGVTHVVREPEEERAAANPVGERVTRLWDELLAEAEKVADGPSGAVYKLPPRFRPVVANHGAAPAASGS
ncbi:MAG: glycosyltransferase family 39 protein [Deltaproteobacteria bacterium]|nr:glycosyltransferase family 39 protein [Deltaproteobacteria bacterium]